MTQQYYPPPGPAPKQPLDVLTSVVALLATGYCASLIAAALRIHRVIPMICE